MVRGGARGSCHRVFSLAPSPAPFTESGRARPKGRALAGANHPAAGGGAGGEALGGGALVPVPGQIPPSQDIFQTLP